MKQEDKFCDISNVVYMNMMSKYCNNPMKQDVIIIHSHTWDWGLIIWCVGKWLWRHATLIVPYLIRSGPRRNWLSSSLINEWDPCRSRQEQCWMNDCWTNNPEKRITTNGIGTTHEGDKVGGDTEMMSVLTWFAALSFVVGFCLLALLCFALVRDLTIMN